MTNREQDTLDDATTHEIGRELLRREALKRQLIEGRTPGRLWPLWWAAAVILPIVFADRLAPLMTGATLLMSILLLFFVGILLQIRLNDLHDRVSALAELLEEHWR